VNSNPILNQIPGLSNLPISNLSQEGIETAFRDKCKNQTNDDTQFDKILQGKTAFENCSTGLLNFTTLQDEIEAAKPTGNLDEVFAKYCRRVPTLINCAKEFYKTVKPCLSETEQDSAKLAANITQSMYDFLCYRDGDRIAMFIAEGGVECVQSKQTEIQNCAKSVFGENPQSFPTEKEKQCKTVQDLQTCVVNDLEKCSEPTPANIIDALFKYVRRLAKCPK